jgi:hypothetical protein
VLIIWLWLVVAGVVTTLLGAVVLVALGLELAYQ